MYQACLVVLRSSATEQMEYRLVMKTPVNQVYLFFLDTGDGANPNKPSITFRIIGPSTASTYGGKAIKIYINGELSKEFSGGGPIMVTNDIFVIGAAKHDT